MISRLLQRHPQLSDFSCKPPTKYVSLTLGVAKTLLMVNEIFNLYSLKLLTYSLRISLTNNAPANIDTKEAAGYFA
jgi:hypothetical protein